MPQLITLDKELIRIGPGNKIEYSTNAGRTWSTRYSGSIAGTFRDLLPYGKEVLAVTSKGVYYSTNEGRTWSSRYTGSTAGEFLSLADAGRELLATTTQGLYYSTNQGRTWSKRH